MTHGKDDAGRCPNCRKFYEDCDAYLREEGVAHGHDPDDYCQRGRVWERPNLRVVKQG